MSSSSGNAEGNNQAMNGTQIFIDMNRLGAAVNGPDEVLMPDRNREIAAELAAWVRDTAFVSSRLFIPSANQVGGASSRILLKECAAILLVDCFLALIIWIFAKNLSPAGRNWSSKSLKLAAYFSASVLVFTSAIFICFM